MFTIPPIISSPPSPAPPPPCYPAPDISANDLSILPVQHHFLYNLSSGSTPSLSNQPHLGVIHPLASSSARSSPRIVRGSDVISQRKREESSDIHDSFEDTLQATREQWSSFDDANDDSYV